MYLSGAGKQPVLYSTKPQSKMACKVMVVNSLGGP